MKDIRCNAGEYEVLIRDSAKCELRGSHIVVHEPPFFAGVVEVFETEQEGATAKLVSAFVGGTPPYVLTWKREEDGDLSSIRRLVDANFTAFVNAPGRYSVMATDSRGCVTTARATVSRFERFDGLTSPLHDAARSGNITALLELCGSSSATSCNVNVNARLVDGSTALLLAVENGHLEAVKFLLGRGAVPLLVRVAPKKLVVVEGEGA